MTRDEFSDFIGCLDLSVRTHGCLMRAYHEEYVDEGLSLRERQLAAELQEIGSYDELAKVVAKYNSAIRGFGPRSYKELAFACKNKSGVKAPCACTWHFAGKETPPAGVPLVVKVNPGFGLVGRYYPVYSLKNPYTMVDEWWFYYPDGELKKFDTEVTDWKEISGD